MSDWEVCDAQEQPSDGWYAPNGSMTADDWDWSPITVIRLPADHPHYAQPEVNGNSRTPTPSPELTARMVALVKRMAGISDMHVEIGSYAQREDVAEARAILAELEPVDGDRNEAERIAYDMEGALPRDLVEAGIKAGRVLAEAGK